MMIKAPNQPKDRQATLAFSPQPLALQKPLAFSLQPSALPRGDLSFIETQFPVSKMSKESYSERKASYSQTLTGLGKWWGRKPLVLCRATIMGLLLPATDNPQKDREVFLRLMTMDDDGMLRRKSANIPAKQLFRRLPPADRTRFFEPGSTEDDARVKRGLSKEAKEELQNRVFLTLSYDERLEYCDRPEQVDGPSSESWNIINAHLGTKAFSLPELVAELGISRFGHQPRIGDSFCGGGSIPFEAARIGCDAFGSDLNPVAAMLTWASLNIVGGGKAVAEQIQKAQREVYDAVDRQITAWAIEHRTEDISAKDWRCLVTCVEAGSIAPTEISRRVPRADNFLYCVEVLCPETGWRVPLASSWVVAEKFHCIAHLIPDHNRKRYDVEILSDVSEDQLKAAKFGTVRDGYVFHPILEEMGKSPKTVAEIRMLSRGKNPKLQYHESGLRLWSREDVTPQSDDVFQERLYCVRWVTAFQRKNARGELVWDETKEYRAPTAHDLNRETLVLELLRERFAEWQAKGCLPSMRIEPGAETERLQRERGWTHWHHLFNPRQLLVLGSLGNAVPTKGLSVPVAVATLSRIACCADWNSRLCRWISSHHHGGGLGSTTQTFYNQALNTLYNYGTRAFTPVWETFCNTLASIQVRHGSVATDDARQLRKQMDIWITDPPYADAVSYHELSNFFLAWEQKGLQRLFPDWSIDTRRALAITGADESFRKSMVECYQNLACHMAEGGFQVVMFTHQNASVWADLSLILWAAGLRVTSAWCIATETESALKQGNYVQGTVLLVLRKQTGTESAFLDEVYQEVEAEVRRQLDTMRDLDDAKDPNFSDTDYQLAAYAAALRVLTSRKIEEIDVAYELSKTRKKGETSPVEALIDRAVEIACDHLVPRGIETHLWKSLTAVERLYLKGLELESHGEHRIGVYQELARGFGVDEYTMLLASTKANETRLKTATEFGRTEMGGDGFGASLVRHALFAACKTGETESPRDAITWLTTEVKDYASNRQRIMELVEFMAVIRQNTSMPHWHKDAEAAGILAGALRNRQDNV